MSAQGKFIIFCAEQYKAAKHLTGKQLSELLVLLQIMCKVQNTV